MSDDIPFDVPGFVSYTQHRLRLEKVGVQHQFPGEMLTDLMRCDMSRDYLYNSVVMRLVTYVLSDTIVNEREEVTVDVPASWWQHLKRDCFKGRLLGWYLRRRPVKVKTLKNLVSFERSRLYPQADIQLPRDQYGMPQYREVIVQGGWG